MISLLMLAAFFAEPIHEVKLDNLGMYLSALDYGNVIREKDHTFLAVTPYHIWHWDKDGKLINRIGGKGEGPGEFQLLSQVTWNGQYYWAIDGQNLTSTIFDGEGHFLSKKNLYFRQFVRTDQQLFVVDYSKYDPETEPYPPTIQEIRYHIDNGQLSVEETGLKFKKVSPVQTALSLNFKLVWVVREKDTYLVVDQLEPLIRIYDQATILQEKSVSPKESFEAKSIHIQAKLWVDPPPKIKMDHKNRSAFLKWWWSWSRINFFAKADEDFIIAYEIPDPKDELNSLQAIQRIDKKGKAIGDVLLVNGFCLGAQEHEVYLFVEDERENGFDYYIRTYRL